MQDEMLAQEPLAIATAELEIVLAKLLVEKPAEGLQKAARHRRFCPILQTRWGN